MSLAYDAFTESLRRCRDLVAVSKYLRSQALLATASEDVLRAALVHGVSALDRYIHERVRTDMLAAARGSISRTDRFHAFALPLGGMLRGNENGLPVELWLNPLIIEQHSLLTFQRADKIADAVKLSCTVEGGLWPAVCATIGESDIGRIKERLNLIVDRRNAIAHEDDTDPSGQRAAIDSALVDEALDFFHEIVTAIDQVVDRASYSS